MHFHRASTVGLLALFLCAAPALATVSLTISDNDATPNSASVAPGSSFNFTVRLVSTSEQVVGLDYYLASSDASGLISIADRNTAGGSFNDPLFFSDTTVEASPSNLLNPRNDHDLGGLATSPLNAGTYLVSNFTMNVAPTAANGFYTIQTTVAQPQEGWIDPNSNEHPFDAHGTFTVFVPEPTGLALLALAAPVVVRRRRR